MTGQPIDMSALDRLEKLVNSSVVTNNNGVQVTLVVPGKLWTSMIELVEKKQDQDFAQQLSFPAVSVSEPLVQEPIVEADGDEVEEKVRGE